MKTYKDDDGFSRAHRNGDPVGKLTHISEVTYSDRWGFTCPECGHGVYGKCLDSNRKNKQKPHFSHVRDAPKSCVGVSEQKYRQSYASERVQVDVINPAPDSSIIFTPYVEPMPRKEELEIFEEVTLEQIISHDPDDIPNFLEVQLKVTEVLERVLDQGVYYDNEVYDDDSTKKLAKLLRSAANRLDPIEEQDEVVTPIQATVISSSTASKQKQLNYSVFALSLANGKYWIDYAIQGRELTYLQKLINEPDDQFLIKNPVVDVYEEFRVHCTNTELKKFINSVSCVLMASVGFENVETRYNKTKLPEVPKQLIILRTLEALNAEFKRVGASVNMTRLEVPRHTIMSNSHGLKIPLSN